MVKMTINYYLTGLLRHDPPDVTCIPMKWLGTLPVTKQLLDITGSPHDHVIISGKMNDMWKYALFLLIKKLHIHFVYGTHD
jgi:hypothetical protein